MKKTPYDVCLILEGTYPFVPGGVSSWVHNLVLSLPEIKFSGVCILPSSKENWKMKYKLPNNFVHLEVVYLHDYEIKNTWKNKMRTGKKQMNIIRSFHYSMFEGQKYGAGAGYSESLISMFQGSSKHVSTYDLIHGKRAWNLLLELYKKPETEKASFIDYFWAYRFTHLPLFNLLRTQIPEARVYHSVSTGYAGLLGVVANQIFKRPLLLTEHGIYTKERKLEIDQAEWIYVAGGERIKVQKDVGTFQKLWMNHFGSIGRITYNKASKIITLFEGNRRQEIIDGADPDKILLIPNGIEIKKYKKLKPLRIKRTDAGETLYVGFVGRVVPIKDVKTFIRACKIVSVNLPNTLFYIIGPIEEDMTYYKECVELVELLGMKEKVQFTGKTDVTEYYKILDLLVMTSISEAQPLVMLEAGCAGIPSVVSDVGACREMVEGRDEEDKKIGSMGIVTGVANPSETAAGILKILSDDDLRQKMSIAARKRVQTYYRRRDLIRRYYEIYDELIKE